MASASKTPNLNLPQWVGTEKPERTDFNAAFDEIDTTVASHLAESVTYTTNASRTPASGIQTIPLLEGKTPMKIDIYAYNGNMASWGIVSNNQRALFFNGTSYARTTTGALVIYKNVSNLLEAFVSIQTGQIELNWALTGTITGVVHFIVNATYHGGS